MLEGIVAGELEDEILLALKGVYRGRLSTEVRADIARVVTSRLLRRPEILVRTLARSGYQPDHFLQVAEGDDDPVWVMQHSLACRVTGRMFQRCEVHQAAMRDREAGVRPKPGRYLATMSDGRLKLSRA